MSLALTADRKERIRIPGSDDGRWLEVGVCGFRSCELQRARIGLPGTFHTHAAVKRSQSLFMEKNYAIAFPIRF